MQLSSRVDAISLRRIYPRTPRRRGRSSCDASKRVSNGACGGRAPLPQVRMNPAVVCAGPSVPWPARNKRGFAVLGPKTAIQWEGRLNSKAIRPWGFMRRLSLGPGQWLQRGGISLRMVRDKLGCTAGQRSAGDGCAMPGAIPSKSNGSN